MNCIWRNLTSGYGCGPVCCMMDLQSIEMLSRFTLSSNHEDFSIDIPSQVSDLTRTRPPPV